MIAIIILLFGWALAIFISHTAKYLKSALIGSIATALSGAIILMILLFAENISGPNNPFAPGLIAVVIQYATSIAIVCSIVLAILYYDEWKKNAIECPKCGTVLAKDTKYCPECGHKIKNKND